jgi:hypothetical protein
MSPEDKGEDQSRFLALQNLFFQKYTHLWKSILPVVKKNPRREYGGFFRKDSNINDFYFVCGRANRL